MIQTLHNIQASTGAVFDESGAVPLSFNNDAEAIAATQTGAALCDRSHWGLLRLSGEDRLTFLHNQSTNHVNARQPGQGCDTVFVTSTARTIDLATAYMTEDGVLLLVSPNRRRQILEWLDRYIFPMDRVKLQDLGDELASFSLIGPQSSQILEKLGAAVPENLPPGHHWIAELGGAAVRIAAGSGLAAPGYTLIVPAEAAADLWAALTDAGAIPAGDRVWERLRIEQGRPVPDRELTEDYNPLEAGLWGTISFEKGCYIGQETIARLNTYNGVKQRLWGIRLRGDAEPGTAIVLDGKKVGQLTSVTETEAGPFGLAYIRTKAGGPGLTVAVGTTAGEIVEVPFLSHPQGSSAPPAEARGLRAPLQVADQLKP
ncbi:MAG: YgfZ/GcvT domain-containing protein [Limnospira sp.]